MVEMVQAALREVDLSPEQASAFKGLAGPTGTREPSTAKQMHPDVRLVRVCGNGHSHHPVNAFPVCSLLGTGAWKLLRTGRRLRQEVAEPLDCRQLARTDLLLLAVRGFGDPLSDGD